MQVLRTVAEVRAARPRLGTLGLVPTMGFLHEGHMSLVARARAENAAVAASIFVNPMQFGANEDLAAYPRDMERDLRLLEAAGTDLVFAPTPEVVYPPGFAAQVSVGPIAEPLEGQSRPGHFVGVATVVLKLFNILQPARAYFGQKDAQQCAVVRRLVRDLDVPVEIVVCPTVREPDGLAMSSRNVYLSEEERRVAPVLHRALDEVRHRHAAGERRGDTLRALLRERLSAEPAITIDYVSVADPDTLLELAEVGSCALVSLAVRLGRTRLIDNTVLGTAAGV